MGINKHFPTVYRHAPIRFQGLNSMDVQLTQHIENIKMFLTHVNQKTQLGLSITAVIESMQLHLCVDTKIFQLDYTKYGILCNILGYHSYGK